MNIKPINWAGNVPNARISSGRTERNIKSMRFSLASSGDEDSSLRQEAQAGTRKGSQNKTSLSPKSRNN